MANTSPTRYKPGDTVGRWTLIRMDWIKKPDEPTAQLYWLCKCQCGTERHVREYTLRYGRSQSCGCLKLEKARARRGTKRTRIYV